MAFTESRRREPRAVRAPGAGFRVIWLGERPWWLDDPSARDELVDVEPGPPAPVATRPLVVHARSSVLPTLRHASRDRLVADLSGVEALDRVSARVARSAEVVLVDDPQRLRLLGRGLWPAWSLLRSPLDLLDYAPEPGLRERRDSEVKRFRRLHRLGSRTLLYAGPYRREGGLHLLLEAAQILRERYEDLVVAAIPDGAVDPRYRDACERQALALGHRGIVEWEVDDARRPLWYALASVVYAAALAPVDVTPALRAAAAGVPCIAGAAEPFADLPGGLAPELVPPGDVAALVERLGRLLADPERARAAGGEARRAAEAELSPAAAARRLRTLWSGLLVRG